MCIEQRAATLMHALLRATTEVTAAPVTVQKVPVTQGGEVLGVYSDTCGSDYANAVLVRHHRTYEEVEVTLLLWAVMQPSEFV